MSKNINNPTTIREEFYKRFVNSNPGFTSDFQSNSNDIQEPDQLLEADPEKVLDFIMELLEEQEEAIRKDRRVHLYLEENYRK